MEPNKLNERRLHMMGTVIDLYLDHENAKSILDEISKQLTVYEKRFSANDPQSELMKININAGIKSVVVDSDLYKLIEMGKHHSVIEDSYLNIAIGPLVQSWRIGFKDSKIPSDKTIQNLLSITNPLKIHLNKSELSVYLEEKGMLLDLGALAKGFIADLIIKYLESINVKSAMINLGGNVKILGESNKHSDGYWRVGIQDPKQLTNENLVVLKIKNQSVVTSGIYERYIKNDGKIYHHILDPKTGYPVESDVASLSIISDSSLDGEIWTTRLFGKNSKEILEIVSDLENIECLIITKNEDIIASKSLDIKKS